LGFKEVVSEGERKRARRRKRMCRMQHDRARL